MDILSQMQAMFPLVGSPTLLGARGGPAQHLPVDGDSNVNKDRTLALHMELNKRHEARFHDTYGFRMKPLKRDDVAKIAFSHEWQKDPKKELDMEGCYFPDSPEAYESLARSRDVDLDKYRTHNHKMEELRLDRLVAGARAAMSTSGNPEALAINYMEQFQFEQRIAGQLFGMFPQTTIPNGKGSLYIPKLGIAQWIGAGQVTTESYAVTPAPISVPTSGITLTPVKFMATTFWSGEFGEDVIAAIVPSLSQAYALGRDVMTDHVILSGDMDTDAGENINAYGGSLALGANDPRLKIDGIRRANWAGTLGGGSAGAFKGHNQGGGPATLDMIADMLAALGKYGVDGSKCRAVLPAKCKWQLVKDAKARPDTYQLLVRKGGNGEIFVADVPLTFLGNSLTTHASSGGVPTYAGWNSEGVPVNLNAAGVYDNTTTSYTTGVVFRPDNWVLGMKRTYKLTVVDLPLSDQFAITGSERWALKPIYDSLGEAVAYNIA